MATNTKERAKSTVDFQKAVLGLEGQLNKLWLQSLEMQITKALVLNRGIRIIQAYVAGNSKETFLSRRTDELLSQSYAQNAQLKQAQKDLIAARLMIPKAQGTKKDAEATLKGLETRIATLFERNKSLQNEVDPEKPKGPKR